MRISNINFEIILNKIRGNRNDLRIINFAFDGLELEHLAQLLAALDNNTIVHTLDLSVNFLQPEAIALLASYLSTHHSFEKLELRGNHMGDENVKLLLDALADNCGVKILDLKDNALSDTIIPSIKQLLNHNTTLQLINLTCNNFSKEGIQELLKIVNIHCLLQLDSKDREYLKIVKASKHKIKLLFKLQIYIRYVLYDNTKYSGEAKTAKKADLWKSIGDIYRGLIGRSNDVHGSIDFFVDHIQSSFETGDFHDPVGFIETCLEDDDLTNFLLYEVIALPDSKSRNEILHTIGEVLFCSEKLCYKSMFNLVNSHICFLNISNKTQGQKRLLLESYRSLVSALGLEDSAMELEQWKRSFQSRDMTYNIENVIEKIDAMIYEQNEKLYTAPIFATAKNDSLLTVLFAHRSKVIANSKIKHRKLDFQPS